MRFEMASRSNSAIAAMMWMVSLFAWGLSNTVAEGGNRRWAEIARQKAFQSPGRGRPEDDLRAKVTAEIDAAAVTGEGSPQTARCVSAI